MIDIHSESYSFVKNKREKFRIEIRKSENKSLIESKRFKSINPDSLKDNINIMEAQNLNLDQILFKIDETIINNDIDSCIKLIELLEYDEQAPSNINLIRKLIKIMRNPCSPSKIINQIGHVFKEFSCGSDEEKKIYVDEGILITLFGILKCNNEISESLVKNIILILSNISWESSLYTNAILELDIIDFILEKFNIMYNNKEIRRGLSYLILNLLENMDHPENLTINKITILYKIVKKQLEVIETPVVNTLDEKQMEILIFLAYSMSKISEMFNPGIIYELICNDLYIIFRIFDLIDTCDKTLINFILPLLDFIEECVSILDHEVGVIIDCGIFETLEIILKQKNNCLIRKALLILTSFPYENDKELGIMVLTTFRTIFLDIFSDSNQENQSKMLKIYNLIITHTENDAIDYLIEFFNSEKLMISLFSLLDSDQIDIILNTLEMIQSAIGFGIQEVSKSNLNVNPIVELLCKNNIHKKIEGLEKNQNKEIEELASYIYEKYLDVE